MWLTTQWKLRRALRRYGRDGDVDAVLGADWSRSREIFAFFREIVDRLHGEEITRLRQKQAEYLALQTRSTRIFCIMHSRLSVRTLCWQIVRILRKPPKR